MSADAKHVLVVEDDIALRTLMRRQLESGGYSVVEAEDGTDIVSLVDREHVEVVISDVVMGGRGGIHLARDVREARPDIPIILVTGALSVGSGPLRDVAEELGVFRIIGKPYDAQALLDAVAAALETPGNRL